MLPRPPEPSLERAGHLRNQRAVIGRIGEPSNASVKGFADGRGECSPDCEWPGHPPLDQLYVFPLAVFIFPLFVSRFH